MDATNPRAVVGDNRPDAGQTVAEQMRRDYAELEKSVAAQLDRQPTPESLKQTNERLKSQFDATMARAKRFDAQSNRSGCTRALNAAKRMYIL